MSLSLSVFSQSGLPKSVGSGGSGRIYRGGNFFFFFFFFEPGVKLDEKSIENGLEGQKFLVVCLFWGGCHHPNNESNSIARINAVLNIAYFLTFYEILTNSDSLSTKEL